MNRPFTLNIETIADWPMPGMTLPQKARFSPDSKWVTYLAPEAPHSTALALWAVDLEHLKPRLLASPPQSVTLSSHETMRRERERQSWDGITDYAVIQTSSGLYFLVSDETGYAMGSPDTPLTHIAGSEGGLDAVLFGGGDRLAMVRDGNLVVLSTKDPTSTRALTFGTDPDLTYGLSDFISAEEFGRQRGFWISPDESWIAFVEADVRHIEKFPLVHFETDPAAVESFAYPATGSANPRYRLGVISSEGGAIQWFDLGPDAEYLAEVSWTPSGHIAAMHLDRSQRRLHWSICDPKTGEVKPFYSEMQPSYVNIAEQTYFLHSGGAITTSESSGYRHLILIDPSGRVRQITEGSWVVTDIVDVNEAEQVVHVVATLATSHQRQLYRVSLTSGSVTPVTTTAGVHQLAFAPNHQWFIDRHESVERSPYLTICHASGELYAPLPGQAPISAHDLGLSQPEWVEIAAEDGNVLLGALYRPTNNAHPPHPLVLSVYGGPHAQRVLDAWSLTIDLEAQYLATQGFLVLKVDNRGSANRGKAFEEALYRRFGTVDVDDQTRAAAWAVRFADADPDRIGITGWSYGGYLTLMAMAKAPHIFKVGVAGAPVTDFRMYDTAYTERYMGDLQENAAGYEQASVFSHLDHFPENLLIIHGAIDENVHFRHSLRLLDAMIDKGLAPELLLLPRSRHLPRGYQMRYVIAQRRLQFLKHHLTASPPT